MSVHYNRAAYRDLFPDDEDLPTESEIGDMQREQAEDREWERRASC